MNLNFTQLILFVIGLCSSFYYHKFQWIVQSSPKKRSTLQSEKTRSLPLIGDRRPNFVDNVPLSTENIFVPFLQLILCHNILITMLLFFDFAIPFYGRLVLGDNGFMLQKMFSLITIPYVTGFAIGVIFRLLIKKFFNNRT